MVLNQHVKSNFRQFVFLVTFNVNLSRWLKLVVSFILWHQPLPVLYLKDMVLNSVIENPRDVDNKLARHNMGLVSTGNAFKKISIRHVNAKVSYALLRMLYLYSKFYVQCVCF